MATITRVWRSLGVSASELRCALTLVNGQSFVWKRVSTSDSKHGEWSGVIRRHVLRLKQTDDDTLYAEDFPGTTPSDQLAATLREYFNLHRDPTLRQLYTDWSTRDTRFSQLASAFSGVRLIRQDPVECLFSFICSSNNHISRIGGMLHKLRKTYGDYLATIEGEEYYAFPTIDQLARATEQELRDLGFGYRARYVVETVKLLQEKGGEQWLLGLRTKPRQEVQDALVEFQGVGRKVADCVALFSLDQFDCIPVDTHVWQIACRDYHFSAKNKSLTKAVYDDVGELFRTRFGTHAGWAHSVLFTADLPSFRHLLPTGVSSNAKIKKSRAKTTATTEATSSVETKAASIPETKTSPSKGETEAEVPPTVSERAVKKRKAGTKKASSKSSDNMKPKKSKTEKVQALTNSSTAVPQRTSARLAHNSRSR